MSKERRTFLKSLASVGIGASLMSSGTPYVQLGTQNEMPEDVKSKDFDLTILQTTDVHCQIHPHDELFWENGQKVFRKTGGYAHLATYLKKLRKKSSYSFLVDTGDMFQGSHLSAQTEGEAMLPILNNLDYDMYIPGNWEVVYGKKQMKKLMGGLSAPKVCTNMYHDRGDEKRGDHIFAPYYIWQVNGVKIGFLGYTDHLVPKRQSPNYSKGILYSKPEENIAQYVSYLKNDEGCAFVIVLAHMGLSQQIHLANSPECEGVDYIFGGDTHERVRKPIQCKYTKVVEPGAFGSFCGRLELKISGGKVVEDQYFLDEITVDKYKSDKKMADIVALTEKSFSAEINEVVGYSTVPLYRYFVIENTIDTMVVDGLRYNLPDVDVVLSNGFRFCPPKVSRDETGNIPITRGFISDMLPVNSPIRIGKVTGKQLKVWLEKELNNVFADHASKRFGGWVTKFEGMKIEFYAFGPEGQRVQSVKIGGLPLDESKVYSIAACERDGDPGDMICRMSGVKEVENLDLTLHEAMIKYLKNNSPVSPNPRHSAKALDASQELLTQVTGVEYSFR